jgi:hypothetical protein
LNQSSPAAVLWARTNGCRLDRLGWERRAHVRLGQCGARHFVARASGLEHTRSRMLRAGAPDSVLFSRAHEALATPFSSASATGLGYVVRNRSTWLEVCQVMIRFGLEQMRVVLRNRSRAKPAARVGTSTPDASCAASRADLHGGINKDNQLPHAPIVRDVSFLE